MRWLREHLEGCGIAACLEAMIAISFVRRRPVSLAGGGFFAIYRWTETNKKDTMASCLGYAICHMKHGGVMDRFWQNLRDIAEKPIGDWLAEERVADISELGGGNWHEVVGRLTKLREFIEKRRAEIFERCLRPLALNTDKRVMDGITVDRHEVEKLVGEFDWTKALMWYGGDCAIILPYQSAPYIYSDSGQQFPVGRRLMKTSDLIGALAATWYMGAAANPTAANARNMLCDAFAYAWEEAGSPDPGPSE